MSIRFQSYLGLGLIVVAVVVVVAAVVVCGDGVVAAVWFWSDLDWVVVAV